MTDMSTAEQIRDKMLESWKRTSANEAGAEIRTELRAVTDGDDPRKVFYGEEMNRRDSDKTNSNSTSMPDMEYIKMEYLGRYILTPGRSS